MRALPLSWSGLVVLLAALAGCSNEPRPVPVRGTVTLDKKPFASGKIYFFHHAGKSSSEAEIKDGAYEGKALPGVNRVEIGSFRAGKPPTGMPDSAPVVENVLPLRYHANSTLKADVTPAGPNEFNFDVQSR